jgi:hypothetical protein
VLEEMLRDHAATKRRRMEENRAMYERMDSANRVHRQKYLAAVQGAEAQEKRHREEDERARALGLQPMTPPMPSTPPMPAMPSTPLSLLEALDSGV